jgi:hypothetical protein
MHQRTDPEHDHALENWKRVRRLWSWMGRSDGDAMILRLLARYTAGAPLSALQRALLGHRQGAGVLRRKSAEAIVAPLLALPYPGQERSSLRLSSYEGPAPRAFLSHLRGLTEDQHFELAECWVAYLRRSRDDAPPPWQPTAAGPTLPAAAPAAPNAEIDLALLELRLARVELAGERLWRQSAADGEPELHARRSAWHEERRALIEEFRRARQTLASTEWLQAARDSQPLAARAV